MRLSILCLILIVNTVCTAQVLTPAKWSFSTSGQTVKLGEEVDLIFSATIDNNWYLYSSEFDCEDGPIKITFSFKPNPSYQLVGKVRPVNPVDKHDKAFDCDVKIFKNTAEFRQRVKVLSPKIKIAGEFDYQVCTEITGQCVPGIGEFLFDGSKLKVISGSNKTQVDSSTSETQQSEVENALVNTNQPPQINNQPSSTVVGPILDPALVSDPSQSQSLWRFMLVAFLAGLAALVTPCVFPMIPMTVSFFTNRGNKVQALIYGFSIILIYTLIGALLAPLMGPETANHLSTEWIPNLIFFVVFIVFGLSFLGLFEITLPGSVINKVDQQAEKGGFGGVFFMAFTLVLVSFSCTGPLVGSILVSSAGGEFLKPIVGMFAFAAAFA
ncbi:MAG: LptF/LptG family permease, partial [Flammeovirgaceae bacterium]